eukprot:NODE_3249_length_579_cov_100.618868_g2735_i0.p1 GENE.NODE_3249_length_579_cov_100.618868_g2735_i0~~NODE_3249_length_579_cov_100.618868_g2735_i0.p1  ORF type:complete len:144 (+),score=23.07 NODE_3249_length_579_cov_100.618868_g2735_i0:65-496(+)
MGQQLGTTGWSTEAAYKTTPPNKWGYSNEEQHIVDWKSPTRASNLPQTRPPLPNAKGHYENWEHRKDMAQWLSWEWSVYTKEVCLVREELKACIARNKPNERNACRDLAEQYFGMVKTMNLSQRVHGLTKTKEPLVLDVLHKA